MAGFGVVWYEGFGEHDYVEASRAQYTTLPELFDALRSGTVSDEELFRALVEGRSDAIHWIRDDLGFELVQW